MTRSAMVRAHGCRVHHSGAHRWSSGGGVDPGIAGREPLLQPLQTRLECAWQQITNNTRFFVLPWVEIRSLASHVLSRVVRQLRADWQRKYSGPLHLVEMFVDTSRFAGSCYRAANWIDLGPATGRTRQDRLNQIQVPPKGVLVYPLRADFRAALPS